MFVCFSVFLTLNQKWGLVNMAVSVAVFVSACFCSLAYMRWARKACCLFIGIFFFILLWFSWGIWSWPVCVCIVCLLLERNSPQCLQSKPTKQHHWSHSSQPPLSEQLDIWPETCFLVFSFFYFTLSTFCIGRASWNWNHGYEDIICLILSFLRLVV